MRFKRFRDILLKQTRDKHAQIICDTSNTEAKSSLDVHSNRMPDHPLVSVIMAAYNSKATLKMAISSILDQDYQNLELIICDDASSDGSWQLACDIADGDDRVILLRNEANIGAGPSRNRCIARARGEFIALMDADDFSMPSRISRQLSFLNEHTDLAFVGTKGQLFNRDPGDTEVCYWFVSKPQRRDFLMTLPFVHASLMFRTDILRSLGGYREDKMVRRSEDYDMLMRAYAVGLIGENIPEPLYCIRSDENTYRRRKYRYRINECMTKWVGFSGMGLMPRGIAYALKPIVVGLIPVRLLDWMKGKYYKKRK